MVGVLLVQNVAKALATCSFPPFRGSFRPFKGPCAADSGLSKASKSLAQVAVSSKMPRVVRITAYDNIALNSLALLFCIGICNGLLDALCQVEIMSLEVGA